MDVKLKQRGGASGVPRAAGTSPPEGGGAAAGPGASAGAPGADRRGGRVRAWGRAVPDAALGVLGVALLAGILEVLPRVGLVSSEYLPPFSDMASALGDMAGEGGFWHAVLDTAKGWGYGLAVSVAAGTVLGLLIGSVDILRKATASTIEFLRPIPSVALVPLAVLVYGTGLESKLLLVVYASFWPVLLQMLHGVQDVDPVARDTAACYRLTAWARLRHVVWPTALPYLMTGVRLAASVALVLAVTAELLIGSPGLGSEIALAQSSNAVPAMYALVIVTGALGVLVNILTRAVEKRVLSWHASARAEAVA
ncbi:ABC transporter permease [Yinghuangia sp. ASG 101]|uniref:ABC transporter permease n=1 Tax=Yinghuangia sp. ASG 101 TaxID=2896848 RepID=UPI001E3BABC8|nr:ABC transporter permease [Yinghuangia sp. ASG 101]UGQ11834.1 ABC transporter permease [Yinghuangia sp. ASG 101]